MEMKRELEVTRNEEIVWGCYCFGAHKSFDKSIVVWGVQDVSTKEELDGGFCQGNAAFSGYAHIEKRKYAKAYIDGYSAFFTKNANPFGQDCEKEADQYFWFSQGLKLASAD